MGPAFDKAGRPLLIAGTGLLNDIKKQVSFCFYLKPAMNLDCLHPQRLRSYAQLRRRSVRPFLGIVNSGSLKDRDKPSMATLWQGICQQDFQCFPVQRL